MAVRGPELPPAFDPRTGEVLADLSTEPTDLLAEIVLSFKGEEKRLAELRKYVEDELIRRVGKRRALITEAFEIRNTGFRRKWDPAELEGVLEELHEEGVLSAPEVAAVLHREPTVDGSEAQRLLKRLRGSALDRVNACFAWTAPKRGRVEITRAVRFLPEDNKT